MDRIWKWLMRANAKGVLACAMVGLIGVISWWAWREFRPYVPKNEPPPIGGGRKMVLGGDLGVMEYLRAQSNAGAMQVPGNPFMSSDEPWHWARRVRRTLRIEVESSGPPPVVQKRGMPPPVRIVKTPPREEPIEPVPVRVVVPPRTSPTRVTSVVLTYRGVFERPDGTVLALIQDSESTKSAFYQSGDELYGVKLVDIAMTNATVETLDGVDVALILSEPLKFVDGRHAD